MTNWLTALNSRTWEVAAELNPPVGGWVEAVVVTRGQVDDHMEEVVLSRRQQQVPEGCAPWVWRARVTESRSQPSFGNSGSKLCPCVFSFSLWTQWKKSANVCLCFSWRSETSNTTNTTPLLSVRSEGRGPGRLDSKMQACFKRTQCHWFPDQTTTALPSVDCQTIANGNLMKVKTTW